MQCSSNGRASSCCAAYWCNALRATSHTHCITLVAGDLRHGRREFGESRRRQVVCGYHPCLARSRCISGGHWLMNLNRKMTTKEMETLQAIPMQRLSLPPRMKARTYHGMLGNAFTVSVVGRIAVRLLRAVGVTTAVGDPWAPGEAGG